MRAETEPLAHGADGTVLPDGTPLPDGTVLPDGTALPGWTRLSAAAVADRLARMAFIVLVAISPWRAHFVLAERPLAPVYASYTDIVVAWSEVALAVALVCWLVGLVLRPRPLKAGPVGLVVPLTALPALAWVAAPFSLDPPLAASNALGLTLAALLALYVVNEVEGFGRLVPIVTAMIFVQALVALAQVAGQSSLGLTVLGEHVVTPATAGASVVAAPDGTRFLRGYGLADHPNILGGILAAGGLLVGIGPGRLRLPAATAAGAVLIVAALALFVTFSRSAWLAAAAGGVVAFVMLTRVGDRVALRRFAIVGATAGVGVLVAAISLAPYLATRLEPGRADVALEARSVDERAALAAAAVRVTAAHPLTGVGAGVLPTALRSAEPDFAFSYQPAHLVLLTVAAEVGLAGGAAWIAVTIAPWFLAWRARPRWTRELAAASAALAAMTIVSLFDYYPWTFPAGRTWWWLVLALWIVAWRRATAGPPDRADA